MKFTKMQGCGNDYVYVDCTDKIIDNADKVAIKVSDRHFGVGADGLILIASSDVADFQMIMYNADGSRGEMCGNGIRCVGKFVYDKGLTAKKTVTVETLAGIKTLELNVADDKVKSVRVDMGSPEFIAKKVPVISENEKMLGETITVDGEEYVVDCISMGNPHCVIRMEEDVRELELEKMGPSFENYKAFPNKINTEFINVLDENRIRMRVWERGSGETLACGTGACASAVSCIINGVTKSPVDVELLGGYLTIEYSKDTNKVTMTGPAEIVFEGEIDV
ncbi:MAG: diaminopimelate epimerase [Lachnospiraceae bacterium]|nr:diaminopimelate epimerase [Lachnospiraceae bacterium]